MGQKKRMPRASRVRKHRLPITWVHFSLWAIPLVSQTELGAAIPGVKRIFWAHRSYSSRVSGKSEVIFKLGHMVRSPRQPPAESPHPLTRDIMKILETTIWCVLSAKNVKRNVSALQFTGISVRNVAASSGK